MEKNCGRAPTFSNCGPTSPSTQSEIVRYDTLLDEEPARTILPFTGMTKRWKTKSGFTSYFLIGYLCVLLLCPDNIMHFKVGPHYHKSGNTQVCGGLWMLRKRRVIKLELQGGKKCSWNTAWIWFIALNVNNYPATASPCWGRAVNALTRAWIHSLSVEKTKTNLPFVIDTDWKL